LPLMTTTLVTFFWLETIEPWICGITFHNRENDLVSSLWSPKLSYGENDAISLIHFLLWRFLPQLPAFPASHHCSSALSSPRLNRTQDQHPHPSRPFLQLTRSKHAARFEALAFTAHRSSPRLRRRLAESTFGCLPPAAKMSQQQAFIMENIVAMRKMLKRKAYGARPRN